MIENRRVYVFGGKVPLNAGTPAFERGLSKEKRQKNAKKRLLFSAHIIENDVFNKCQKGACSLPFIAYPKIEKLRLKVEISNFLKKGWEKRVALLIKAVHLAEICKKVHRIFSRFSNGLPERFENRSAMTLLGKTWNRDAVSRFSDFFGNA